MYAAKCLKCNEFYVGQTKKTVLTQDETHTQNKLEKNPKKI